MDNIIFLVIMWATGIIFVIVGIYAMNRKKPMWFWAGSQVPESTIKDVKGYNRANGKMWCAFSVPFFICGIVEYFSPILSLIIFGAACIVGIGGIVWCYHKIEEKYFLK